MSNTVELKQIGLIWSGHLSCIGNPSGVFKNKEGVVIAYSSYDQVCNISDTATPKQKEYLEKYS